MSKGFGQITERQAERWYWAVECISADSPVTADMNIPLNHTAHRRYQQSQTRLFGKSFHPIAKFNQDSIIIIPWFTAWCNGMHECWEWLIVVFNMLIMLTHTHTHTRTHHPLSPSTPKLNTLWSYRTNSSAQQAFYQAIYLIYRPASCQKQLPNNGLIKAMTMWQFVHLSMLANAIHIFIKKNTAQWRMSVCEWQALCAKWLPHFGEYSSRGGN